MDTTKFEGWLGQSPDSINGKMVWGEFEPKKWTEDDVDIQITHCGMCGSDLHTLKSGWGETPYPCCVGHEIVGKAVRVGGKVKNIKVGDRVGVGAQGRSCLQPDCPQCSNQQENYCKRGNVGTYGDIYADNEGKSMGGYADYNRTNGHFVFKIPDGLSSASAAPMLCGGITVYSPLKNYGCGPGKAVGIVGVGGLGHFGVLFAKALGADKVVGVSRKASKKEEVLKLGADSYIATDDDENWSEAGAQSLDLIVCTVSSDKMPLDGYLKLLKVGGTFVQVGAPDEGKLPALNIFTMLMSGLKFAGSGIGPPSQIKEMLQLAAEKNIQPWIEQRPMKEANQAVVDLVAGKPRFRYVLVNEKHA
ncbi:zinc-binding dehydrogenase [Fusarium heterosporum]|uniref:alcohol dehydrogenase (NADP(+)) n=1 Tax=Fusarium heterosporum TaxID=42747 RepID=A0A8H5WLM9_FUSHE|nr:zinc-binding dehydrogenase [Fusarium heterosporum]